VVRNHLADVFVVENQPAKEVPMSILWIILIVVLVLALLGFFGRGRL
jgi:uncharacterized membrane protein